MTRHKRSGHTPWAGLAWRMVANLLALAVHAVLVTVIVGAVVFGVRGSVLGDAAAWTAIAIAGGLMAVFGITQASLLGLRGWTVSQGIVGYRVVDVGHLRPIGVVRAGSRQVAVVGLTVLSLGVFALASIVVVARDRQGRGWHDRWFRTVAVWPDAVGGAPRPQASLADRVAAYVGPASAQIDDPPAEWSSVSPPGPPPAPAPPTPAPPAPEPDPAWVLSFDLGQIVEIDRRVVVGREPQPDTTAGACVVDDPDRSVSRTHAVIWPDADALWITDLDSTHGVRIRGSADEQRLIPGVPASLRAGDVVVLGLREARVRHAD